MRMIYFFWFLCFVFASFVATCSAAFADVDDVGAYHKRMTLMPADDRCFAIVRIVNKAGVYNNVERLATDKGAVSVQYATVGGHNPEDHDLVDVLELPEGVVAHPLHIDLPDGDIGYICLMVYQGG